MLQAGVSRATITPPLTVPHAGWGAQSHVLPDGVEHELWMTALYLTDGHTAGMIMDLDLSLLFKEHADRMREQISASLGIAMETIRISTTHTHAGPLIQHVYYKEHEQAVAEYVLFLERTAVEMAQRARAQAKPVRLQADYGVCTGIGYNRRQALSDGRVVTGYEPEAFTDPVLGAIRLSDATSGETVLSLAHFSCHPTTLGPENRLVSPDYPGTVKRTLEQLVGGQSLFLQGAAGDIGPGPEGFHADYAAVARMGRTVASAAAHVLLSLEAKQRIAALRYERIVESGATLAMWSCDASAGEGAAVDGDPQLHWFARQAVLPLQRFMAPDEAERIYNGHHARLEHLLRSGGPEREIKEATYKVKRSYKVLRQARLYEGQTELAVEVMYIVCGELALVSVPLEPFARTGQAIRDRSPFAQTMFSGYSNGWLGYIPLREEYARGGYEVETSLFAAGAAELLEEHVVATLRELAEQLVAAKEAGR